jgi:subtilase family serine protease
MAHSSFTRNTSDKHSAPRTQRRRFGHWRQCRFEHLELRQVLSASASADAILAALQNVPVTDNYNLKTHQTVGPTGFTPTQILKAYGFTNVTLPGGAKPIGTGETIAIIDSGNAPTITADLKAFDAQFGIPDPPSFRIVNQNGQSAAGQLPPTDLEGSVETSLDVEWAHAIAPGANILLVEATALDLGDMLTANMYAAKQPGVVVVSNSWGGPEFLGETAADFAMTTPAGHAPVQFVFSAGDSGAPASYPAVSPNVLAVGGTSLKLTASNTIASEVVWNDGPGDAGGGGESGMTISGYPLEGVPNYQYQDTASNAGVLSTLTGRGTPDVSYVSDPNTGFPVRDSAAFGAATPWEEVGGTSDAAPQWSALIAIADQGRALSGKAALSNIQSVVYKLPASDFHDIVSGTNGNLAGPGYDLASGLGSPVANLVISGLIAFNGSSIVSSTHAAVNNSTGSFYFFNKMKLDDGTGADSSAAAVDAAPDAVVDASLADAAFSSDAYSAAQFDSGAVSSAGALQYDNAVSSAFDSSDDGTSVVHRSHGLHDADVAGNDAALDDYFATV